MVTCELRSRLAVAALAQHAPTRINVGPASILVALTWTSYSKKTKPKAIETRVAFRTLIDCIVVHPGRKRMPYEYTPYLNSAALFGKQLFPEKGGKGKEIGKSA